MSTISTRITQHLLGALLWIAVLLALIVVWHQSSSQQARHVAVARN